MRRAPLPTANLFSANNDYYHIRQFLKDIPVCVPTQRRPSDKGCCSVDPQNHKRWLPFLPSACPHISITILNKRSTVARQLMFDMNCLLMHTYCSTGDETIALGRPIHASYPLSMLNKRTHTLKNRGRGGRW